VTSPAATIRWSGDSGCEVVDLLRPSRGGSIRRSASLQGQGHAPRSNDEPCSPGGTLANSVN
jgi:hypothetical protein